MNEKETHRTGENLFQLYSYQNINIWNMQRTQKTKNQETNVGFFFDLQ